VFHAEQSERCGRPAKQRPATSVDTPALLEPALLASGHGWIIACSYPGRLPEVGATPFPAVS
jgi:hypothetical protein